MKYRLVRSTSRPPVRGTKGAAAFDLFCDSPMHILHVGEHEVVPTGVILEIEKGWYGQIAPRSGLALNNGIIVMGGVIDSDYRGEVKVILHNAGRLPLDINMGDRIAQLLILPCYQGDLTLTESVSSTERGGGGFGSTGK